MRIPFDNTFVGLPESFFAEAEPSAAVHPTLIAFNEALAGELGIERGDASDEDLARIFSGARLPEGAQPIATVYAGHQFGHPVPRLGDGRAILLGEVVGQDGRRDVQLKGAGRTHYSRGGDGRSPLGPVLREYVVSEAMHALGVPTTRALAAVTTGDKVLRDGALPGAVFTRVASSHLRIGTFEYFAARRMVPELQVLLDYAIRRHDPDLEGKDDRALLFLRRVAERTLSLVTRWWGVGFIHGVMNTDNTSVSGETLDFGPCAFMDAFRFDKVFSSIDRRGRYRFEHQGPIGMWNLSVLAGCLVPLVDEDPEKAVPKLEEVLSDMPAIYERRWLEVMTAKLGIGAPKEGDAELVKAYLEGLEAEGRDYTNAFRALSGELDAEGEFHERWRARLADEGRPREEVVAQMHASNPAVIPRNHQIEHAIVRGREGDFAPFHALHAALRTPYVDGPELEPFQAPPTPEEEVTKTFCGT